MNHPWAKGISKITFVPDLGSSPANVNRVTGELQISQKWWDILPPCHRAFILMHEYAHLSGQTVSEKEADKIGYAEFLKLGFPDSCSISALQDVLSFRVAEHHERLNEQRQRVDKFKHSLAFNYYSNNPKKQWEILHFQ